jgi:hypothetical protein
VCRRTKGGMICERRPEAPTGSDGVRWWKDEALSGSPRKDRWMLQFRRRIVMGRFERLGRAGVKASMDRVRIVLCSLLPVLWVLAAGHCVADPASACPDGCGRTLVSAAGHDGHTPLNDVRSFEPPARLLNRRMGTPTGWGIVPALPVGSASGLHDLERALAPLTVSPEALGLAKCWQFYWRTASEPRAPSFVS